MELLYDVKGIEQGNSYLNSEVNLTFLMLKNLFSKLKPDHSGRGILVQGIYLLARPV